MAKFLQSGITEQGGLALKCSCHAQCAHALYDCAGDMHLTETATASSGVTRLAVPSPMAASAIFRHRCGCCLGVNLRLGDTPSSAQSTNQISATCHAWPDQVPPIQNHEQCALSCTAAEIKLATQTGTLCLHSLRTQLSYVMC